MNLALDTLEKRKSVYSDVGVLYYQPWVVLMTDGQPNGDPAVLDRAVQRVTDLVAARKLTVFPSASAADADIGCPEETEPEPATAPTAADSASKSSSSGYRSLCPRVSRPTPGDIVKLDRKGLADWAELKGSTSSTTKSGVARTSELARQDRTAYLSHLGVQVLCLADGAGSATRSHLARRQ